MAQDGRDLLDRHPVGDHGGGQGAAELVRMNVIDAGSCCEGLQHDPGTAGLQPFMALADEQRRVVILTGAQVPAEVHGGDVIKVHRALFVALAQDQHFLVLEVQILPVQLSDFADPAAGGQQEREQGHVPGRSAGGLQLFEIDGSIRFPDLLRDFDGAQVCDRVLLDQALTPQPAEEAAEDLALALQGAVRDSAGLLLRQPGPEMVHSDAPDRHGEIRQEPAHDIPVPLHRLLAAVLDEQGRQPGLKQVIGSGGGCRAAGLQFVVLQRVGHDSENAGEIRGGDNFSQAAFQVLQV